MGTGDWHNSSTGLCAEAGSRKQQAEFLCLAFLHSIPVTLSCLPSSLWLPQTPSSGKPNEQEKVMTEEAIPAAGGGGGPHHLLLSVFPAPPFLPSPDCLVLRELWCDLCVTLS